MAANRARLLKELLPDLNNLFGMSSCSPRRGVMIKLCYAHEPSDGGTIISISFGEGRFELNESMCRGDFIVTNEFNSEGSPGMMTILPSPTSGRSITPIKKRSEIQV